MKLCVNVVATLVGVVVLAGCQASGEAGAEPMTATQRAEVGEVLFQMERDWVAANESGDVDTLDRLFAEDFIYTVTDGTLHERDSFMALVAADPIDYDSARVEGMELRWYEDVPVVTGVGADYWTEDGRPRRQAYRFTNVFVERDGRWQVVVGHSSGDL